MSLKTYIIFSVVVCLLVQQAVTKAASISSFEQLAELHCQQFPVQILYRLSSGTLAQKFGSQYSEIDCYVRQFINDDGQNRQEIEAEEDEEQQDGQNSEEEQSGSDQTSGEQEKEYKYPEIDPIVAQYAPGLKNCLPQGVDPVKATYKIWRFYRYVFQHDYLYEWMRAKIRSALGYEAERPNAWMDGDQSAARLRLDKLFSNEFYDYVDKLMFKDFLFPLMTFLRKNVVVGLDGSLTSSGKPILLQYIESRNILDEVFKPIVFSNAQTNGQIFTYTLPGIPLFFGGSSVNFMWAFTGVLVDRSNIEQIQTVGNKFYHHGIEEWVQLRNETQIINVKDQEPFTCSFMHSSYGTLYEKHNASGKVSEYIARWHENEPRVRNLFSEIYNLIRNQGNAERDFDFPFNSVMMANSSGLFHYLCQQRHPSYFIYPDLASEPDALPQRWISDPKKGLFVVANTHLTTQNQVSYINKENVSPTEEQITMVIRRLSKEKFDTKKVWDVVSSVATDPLIKKRKQVLIFIYRKAKFVFFPDDIIRKECDQLLSVLQKWDDNLNSETQSPVFILWDYFFREYTFNHVSASKFGKHIAKHRALTDAYWTGQPDLWKKVVSYGECDSNQWFDEKWDVRLNNTGLNCTCFFNVMRGINRTREILRNSDGSIPYNIPLAPFTEKKRIELTENYLGTHIEEAFSQLYSKNLGFVAELQNPSISYLQTYKEIEETVTLSSGSSSSSKKEQKESEEKPSLEEL